MTPAERFLEALTGSAGTPVTWQSFDDSTAKKKALARILHGPLVEHETELRELNDRGAGIFVTINETDLRGRKAGNVVALRAGFADDDRGDLVPRVPPSYCTRTRRGINPFWNLVPGEELSRFREMQSRLIACYRSDKSAKDLPRVMRCPGFYHRKAEPVMVDFLPGTGRRWTIDELLAAHPAPQQRVVVQATAPAQGSLVVRSSGGGREAALVEVVRQKAEGRSWAIGDRHDSGIETATHARKIGLSKTATRDLVDSLLAAAGKTDEAEADEIATWAWENVSPDPKELEERPPSKLAESQLRQGVKPDLVAARLMRWRGLTAAEAVSIVDKACAAELRRHGVQE